MTPNLDIICNPGGILLSAALFSVFTVWGYSHRRGRQKESLFRYRHVPLTILGILFCGLFVVQWGGAREAARQRLVLIDNASRAALAVNRVHLESLSATSADLESPHYRRLKEQFQVIRRTMPNTRFLYLICKVGGRIIFQVDSEKPGSPDESPPGQVYSEADPAFLKALDEWKRGDCRPLHRQVGNLYYRHCSSRHSRDRHGHHNAVRRHGGKRIYSRCKGESSLSFALLVCGLSLAVYLGFACMINFKARWIPFQPMKIRL